MLSLSGVIPPVVTPLADHDQLDVAAVDTLVQHLVSGQVDGLFILGTTGEGPSLNYRIRYELIERTCEAAEGRVPVLAGITDCSLSESIQMAEHALNCGATAVVAAAPWYFSIDQADAVRWFRQLADAVPLPLVLYNMPSCVDLNLTVDTVAQLAEHPNIVAIKDSSGDLQLLTRLCTTLAGTECSVFVGPEELIPQAVAAGVSGAVCGGGNLLPSVYKELFSAAAGNDAADVDRLSRIVQMMFESVYTSPSGKLNIIPALKYALSQQGLCRAVCAPPLAPITDEHADRIAAVLPQILQAAETVVG